MANTVWMILCDVSDCIHSDNGLNCTVLLPGKYKTYEDAHDAIRTLVRQKAREFRDEGLFVICEDVNTGEVCATNGYGCWFDSVSYYARRQWNKTN